MAKNRYVFLKCGSNILRIINEVLENDSLDYANYLEIRVADGHGQYHFEKNKVSACIAEDYDIKQLKIVDWPLEHHTISVRTSPTKRITIKPSSSALRGIEVSESQRRKISNNKKRTNKISTKDVSYAY